jgi:predicted metal-dependent peptidase
MSEFPENLQAARLWLGVKRPYLASVLWALRPVHTPGLGTLAVDKHWRLYYDDNLGWSHEETIGVLYHEVQHILRDHPGRAEQQADAQLNGMAWNVCADAEINDDILVEGLKLPKGVVTPKDTLNMPDNLLAEEYFQKWKQTAKKMNVGMPKDGQSQPGKGECGSCAGGPARSWEKDAPAGVNDKGESVDRNGNVVPDGVGEGEAELVRRKVAEDIKSSPNQGDIPEYMKRWAESTLDPKVDWRKVLRGAIRRCMTDIAGMVDYSYSRPSRRSGSNPKFVLPSLRQPIPDVAVVLDTSGSMGTALIAAALAEVDGVLKQLGLKTGVRAIVADADVKSSKKVTKASKIELEGGGGTDMRVGVREALKKKPHAVIVLTDGYTPWPTPSECGSARIIAGLLGAGAPKAPAHIKSVVIEDEAA